MFEAIAASSLTVYVLFSLMSVVLFFATYKDSLAVAFWATVIAVLGFQFFTAVDPYGYVTENPKDLLLFAAAYFPIGIAWSFFRWWRVLKNKAAQLVQDKPRFHPDNYIKTWAQYVRKHMPKAAENKSSITCWITYWPFSVASYLLVDILCDIGNWIYSLISGAYQRMADRITASIGGLED